MKEVKYQVTLFCSTGQYRPISCIVIMKQEETAINLLNTKETRKEITNKGIIKICQKRYWTKQDLLNYQYLKVKAKKIEEG